MSLSWLDRLGDWNPQLFREIKGRLTVRNIAIAVGTSLLGQLLVLLYWFRQIPNETYPIWGPYCRLRESFEASQRQVGQLQTQYHQLQTQLARYSGPKHYDSEKVQTLKASIASLKERIQDLQPDLNSICPADAIEFQQWWQDHYPKIFTSLSVIVMFALLVVGSYLLISDLAREERRGTLNFIRLSPQSTRSVLIGKLLGVPILLYLGAILTVPLGLWSGLSAHIPLVEIFSFWVVLAASCAFFYSAALLFGLISSWLGGFQSWLGSGAVLLFLMVANSKSIEHSSYDLLNLLCPSVILRYLVDRTGSPITEFGFSHTMIQGWQWFYLPLGVAGISVFVFTLLNYGLWTYWIGQALNRRFRNPNATMLSKQQSYLLIACSTLLTLGFALQSPKQVSSSQFTFNLHSLLTVNLVLFLGLIAALSPHRQALQDWARYRHLKASKAKRFWNSSLIPDLIWGEKSPVLGAIAINLVIAFAPVVVWILLGRVDSEGKLEAFSSLVLILSGILLYAAIAQLMLMMKTPTRAIWTTATIVAASLLPPVILNMLSLTAGQNYGSLWLLTSLPWNAVQFASMTRILQVLFVQWTILGLLNLQLTRQLQRAGESASKALLAGRQPVDQ